MSGNSQTPVSGRSCASIIAAIIAVLGFLGFATIYDIIPREWIPQNLQPKSWQTPQSPVPEVDRSDLPLLFSENFDDPDSIGQYSLDDNASISNGRLRFYFDEPKNGSMVELPGEYEQFSLAFTVYPVGEMSDETVNILFHVHDSGWSEIWLRPRRNWLYAFKTSEAADFDAEPLEIEYLSKDDIRLGANSTRIQLDVDVGKYTLFMNGVPVATLMDQTNPYLRGKISLGAGAGEFANVGVDIDNIEIRGR